MTNLSPTNLTPGSFIQLNIPLGPGSAADAAPTTLYIGSKLSTAPAVVNQLYGPDIPGYTVLTHNDVVTAFGLGSEINLAYNAGVLNDSTYTKKYFICAPESTGSAASATVTLTGTAATSYGTITTSFFGGQVTTNVTNGDTAATICTNIALSINSQTEWGVTASASSNTVVITAKNKGPRGNSIRFACQVNNGLTGITSSAQSFANLTGGTVEDVWTTTLANIASRTFDFIVSGAEDPATNGNAGLLSAQVTSQNLAIPGLPCRIVDGYVGTEAAAAAFTNTLNNVFGACAWELNSNYTPLQLASHLAGALAACENQSIPIFNVDGVGTRPGTEAFWQFGVPFDGTITSSTDVVNALISGLTPIVTTTTGKTKISKACTMYHVNPSTSTLDLRATDWCDVHIGNLVRSALKQMWSTDFNGKTAAQNPQPGDKAPNGMVVTPDILTAHIGKVLLRAEDNGWIQDFNVQFLSLTATGTFNYIVEIQPITLAHQFNVDLNVVTAIL